MVGRPYVRTAHEVASQFGVSVDDLRIGGSTSDKKLKAARDAYAAGIADGTVEDPAPTGPTVEADADAKPTGPSDKTD